MNLYNPMYDIIVSHGYWESSAWQMQTILKYYVCNYFFFDFIDIAFITFLDKKGMKNKWVA